MGWLSAFAIFFIIWWVVLFTTLPIGVRSQHESNDIVPGSEPGAPMAPDLRKKALITTGISIVIFSIFYYVSIVLGYSVDDLPSFVPDLKAGS